MSETPKSPISRRRFLHTTAALGGEYLGGRRAPSGAARAQGSLKGTKLTVVADLGP